MVSDDWRRTRSPAFRQCVINTIVNSIIIATGMPALYVQNYVTKFEQEIYNIATSQLDYTTRISEEIASFEKKYSVQLDISYHRGDQSPSQLGSQKQLRGSYVQSQNVAQQCSMYQRQQLLNLRQEAFQQPTQHHENMMQPHGTPFNMMQPEHILHSTAQEQDQQLSQMMVQQQPSSHGIKQMHAQMKTGVQYGQLRQLGLHTGRPEASVCEVEAYDGSPAQTRQNAVDWVEDAYNKLQSLKEKYYMDIHNIYSKANEACEQFGGGERQISFRRTLGNILEFLKLSKNDIISIPSFEVNLGRCEKQIFNVILAYKNFIRSAEQPETPAAALLSVKAPLQQLDSQTQFINMQSSHATVATAKGDLYSPKLNLRHSEPAQNISLAHENALVSSSQNVNLQRSIVSGVQHGGMSTLPQGESLLQPNRVTLKSSASIIREYNLKVQQEREQNWKRELMIESQQRKQQVIEREQLRQQQFHQPGQSVAKMPQINESNIDAEDLTKHQQSQTMQDMPQSGQLNISRRQFLQSDSPQKSQASSPQNMDVGTNIASSPSTLPSPEVNIAKFPAASLSPATVLSPINLELYSPTPKMPSASNLGNLGSEHATQENSPLLVKPLSPDQRSITGNESILIGAEDLVVVTDRKRQSPDSPGNSSPSAKEKKTDVDATLLNAPSPVNVVTDRKRHSSDSPGDGSPSAKEKKTDVDATLLNAPSPVNVGNSSVTGNESILIGAEDLVVVRDGKRKSPDSPDDSSPSAKKIRRDVDATLVNVVSPVNVRSRDNSGLSSSFEAPELESTATSRLLKVNEAEAKQYSLIDEIEDIKNLQLINTVVEISDENSEAVGGEGTIVKCTYTTSVSRQLDAQLDASPMQRSMTLRLLVPKSYPGCSPVPLDDLPAEASDQIENFSRKAKALFDLAASGLTHSTLAEIVSTWHSCARQATRYFA